MGRGVVALDRLAAFALGVLLVAGGAAALGWKYNLIPDAPERIRLPELADLAAQDWWPWATGAAGVVLVLLSLTWLLRHIPRRRVGRLSLTGGDATGRLGANVDSAVGAAGEVLAAATPGVRSCSGHLITDRGQVVAELRPTIEPDADLLQIRAAAERVLAELDEMVGREELRGRVQLHVARRATQTARVQ